MSKTIGIVDTMFAKINMGEIAINALSAVEGFGSDFSIERKTVPGFKDLAPAAKQLIDDGSDIVVALGMPGGADLDRMCAHEASMGITIVQALSGKHVLEVFVHEVEGNGDPNEFRNICYQRCAKHAINAHQLLFSPEGLISQAGMGIRQGSDNVGSLE